MASEKGQEKPGNLQTSDFINGDLSLSPPSDCLHFQRCCFKQHCELQRQEPCRRDQFAGRILERRPIFDAQQLSGTFAMH